MTARWMLLLACVVACNRAGPPVSLGDLQGEDTKLPDTADVQGGTEVRPVDVPDQTSPQVDIVDVVGDDIDVADVVDIDLVDLIDLIPPPDTPDVDIDEDEPCTPACDEMTCGPDGCGGMCECPVGHTCIGETCVIVEPCGNAICEDDEDPCTCPQDCPVGSGNPGASCCDQLDCEQPNCGPCCWVLCEEHICTGPIWGDDCCGNGECEVDAGETPQTCVSDCGYCGDGFCMPDLDDPCNCPGDCGEPCQEKECGGDGCGGECGTCEPGYECNDWGACICIPDCEGTMCGDDNGCGSPCAGACPFVNQICINASCVCGGISCEDKVCGDDNGCGEPCDLPCTDPGAECTPDGCACSGVDCEGDCCAECEVCLNGQCWLDETCCVPDCLAKLCGEDDGCGGFCDGTCPDLNQVCNDELSCVCSGEFCDGECCPEAHVCLNNECCEVLTCEGEGWECGAHYVGCSNFADCGSCGVHGVCTQEFFCDCDYLECAGACCAEDEICLEGQCVFCESYCSCMLCGEPDGCGGICNGQCPDPLDFCKEGECVDPQYCGDVWCGDFGYCVDGVCQCEGNNGFKCGEVCCSWGQYCENGICQMTYAPDCFGKACGSDDGFGGVCLTGSCGGPATTCVYGVCVCEFCACGSECCTEDEVCTGEQCVCEFGECGDACCAEGEVCIDDACVCEFEACGDICCAENQICQAGQCI